MQTAPGFLMTGYRIIIADDHPLFRGALRQALVDAEMPLEALEAGNLEDVIALLDKKAEPDLVLLDLKMPGVQGFSGLIFLRAQYPSVPIVVVSATEDTGSIRRSLDFGASGFIPKSTPVDKIRRAVKAVLSGEVWVPDDFDPDQAVAENDSSEIASKLATLTPQQVRVLMMLGEGLLNKQIAYELGVSEATIKAHVSAILQKLGVESRTQAVIAVNRIEGAGNILS
jgi:DNA-binding NarL/FixJ family response regulator